ncbi:hypothetical protein EYF80_030921 [Liparis tanakae]|uniref:Uncharacterized protein n=1 Tax=Liparis tanakae TaxID=230148 RepID=A0A4Z2GZ06_9TELE|nr:hypothetical protein EYF80_030921 [Liparis tanakae]
MGQGLPHALEKRVLLLRPSDSRGNCRGLPGFLLRSLLQQRGHHWRLTTSHCSNSSRPPRLPPGNTGRQEEEEQNLPSITTCKGKSDCTWVPEGELANRLSGPCFKRKKPEEFGHSSLQPLTHLCEFYLKVVAVPDAGVKEKTMMPAGKTRQKNRMAMTKHWPDTDACASHQSNVQEVPNGSGA